MHESKLFRSYFEKNGGIRYMNNVMTINVKQMIYLHFFKMLSFLNKSINSIIYNSFLFRYLLGGVKSGFTKISDIKVEKRLYMVKGKRDVRIIQVYSILFYSLNVLVPSWFQI